MSEQKLQFRVGIFVLIAMGVGAGLILQFSNLKQYWRATYPLAIHFEDAPGIQPGAPVRQNGVNVGTVRAVQIDEEHGGVLVVVDIDQRTELRMDSEPQLRRSLFGDSRIEFSLGRSQEILPPRTRLEGSAPSDPMEMVQKLERNVSKTLVAFEATSEEWRTVARNLNGLMETNRGHLDDVIERSALALDTFNQSIQEATATFQSAGKTLDVASRTLANANDLISDPQLQGNLRQTAAELPKLAAETRMTIAAARTTIQQVSNNLDTIQAATAPLAEESGAIVNKLSGSLIQLEGLLTELHMFSKLVNSKDGSLQRLAGDPDLYQNLNRSAQSLNVLMTNLEPVVRDIRIFSDRIARHPEILGVSGAVKGSSGIKASDEVQPAGYSTSPSPMR
ncbi:MAG: MCE family protein [Planctomycetaceae bacterium]|nr:MCE family protein [Planctomycetaceae bacterium]